MNSQSLFKQHFHYSAESSSEAHGRVNLIGEHTDYNNGFVLPTLIEQKIEVSLGPRSDTQIVGISEEFGEKTISSDSKIVFFKFSFAIFIIAFATFSE